MSNRLTYLAGNRQPDDPEPQRPPTSSSDLRSRLSRGLEEVVSQVPPQYRAMAQLLLPRLRASLLSASDPDLRRSLSQIRDVIDGLLYDQSAGPGSGA